VPVHVAFGAGIRRDTRPLQRDICSARWPACRAAAMSDLWPGWPRGGWMALRWAGSMSRSTSAGVAPAGP
jgi:hypothetical protein